MIQRVQSIFLFLVGMCMFLVLFFPLWEKVSIEDQQVATLSAYSLTLYTIDTTTLETAPGLISEMQTYYIAIVSILAALVAFYSIFKYKNRLTQMKLGALNSLLMAAVLGVSLYIATSYGNPMLRPEVEGSYKLGFFFPAFALIFNVLSNRFIRRDEKLVRSVDRIR
ncbi:MAG: DUF4293 domain-containing protein [Bacteroidota bacterium]|nr:DUF4293 domain-containing protein [Bacteroidota bacterium]